MDDCEFQAVVFHFALFPAEIEAFGKFPHPKHGKPKVYISRSDQAEQSSGNWQQGLCLDFEGANVTLYAGILKKKKKMVKRWAV